MWLSFKGEPCCKLKMAFLGVLSVISLSSASAADVNNLRWLADTNTINRYISEESTENSINPEMPVSIRFNSASDRNYDFEKGIANVYYYYLIRHLQIKENADQVLTIYLADNVAQKLRTGDMYKFGLGTNSLYMNLGEKCNVEVYSKKGSKNISAVNIIIEAHENPYIGECIRDAIAYSLGFKNSYGRYLVNKGIISNDSDLNFFDVITIASSFIRWECKRKNISIKEAGKCIFDRIN